ncbi:MAG: HAMP domain-containing histidine kinase [Ignavibacteriaceae bacterium]|jgi:signal transduction histidine kinase|nr:HAMP domain-containing histidine kinase [Ignavibacteriaceae bacterium]
MIKGSKEVLLKKNILLKDKISELQVMQSILKNVVSYEKEQNQLKSKFIATAAHELRTPLTTILNSAEFLNLVGQNCNEQKFYEHIGKIQNSVSQLRELFEDVLTITKIEIGQSQITNSIFNLEQLCTEVIKELKTLYNNHPIKLKYLLHQKEIIQDKNLLRHVIMNLLSNACKYSSTGDQIYLEVSPSGEMFMLSVEDKGSGISKEDQKNIFEPFVRGKNKEEKLGTGLGLTIVKKIVELLNGNISLFSEENIGTTVTIFLPFDDDEENQ